MGYSHDQTPLAAKFGFLDPDRKNPIHALGCQFFREPIVYRAVHKRMQDQPHLDPNEFVVLTDQPIYKGRGQYKTTIGFADAIIGWNNRSSQFIEVKIAPVSTSDVLTQVNFYRGYVGDRPWILAAAYDMNKQYVDVMHDHGVYVFRLGSVFQKWAEERAKDPIDASVPELGIE